jgi:hypothetical protein
VLLLLDVSNADHRERDAEEYEQVRTNQHGPCKKQNAVDAGPTIKSRLHLKTEFPVLAFQKSAAMAAGSNRYQ